MGPLAPCIHTVRQGLTVVDGVGYGFFLVLQEVDFILWGFSWLVVFIG
jgi:hypothetical protein